MSSGGIRAALRIPLFNQRRLRSGTALFITATFCMVCMPKRQWLQRMSSILAIDPEIAIKSGCHDLLITSSETLPSLNLPGRIRYTVAYAILVFDLLPAKTDGISRFAAVAVGSSDRQSGSTDHIRANSNASRQGEISRPSAWVWRHTLRY